MATWKQIFAAEQRKLPKGATPKERGEATKRAARIYHGQGIKTNPDSQNWLLIGAVVVGGYLLLQNIKPQPVLPAR